MKSAIDDWKRAMQDRWPTPNAIVEYERDLASRVVSKSISADYQRERIKVISNWAAWLRARDELPEDPPEEEPFVLTAPVGKKRKTKPAPAPPEPIPEPPPSPAHPAECSCSGVRYVKLDAQEHGVLIEEFRGVIFGREASQDYWGTVVRKVHAQLSVDGIAAICDVEKNIAENWTETARVPRKSHEKMEDVHATLIVRRMMERKQWDIDEFEEWMSDLMAHVVDRKACEV